MWVLKYILTVLSTLIGVWNIHSVCIVGIFLYAKCSCDLQRMYLVVFYYKSYGRGDLASHCWYTLYTTDSVNLLFMFIAIRSLVGIVYMPHAPMTHN